ncbi:MAG: ankyrin repeat domain-containing protein [Vicinamibacteria bacterium]
MKPLHLHSKSLAWGLVLALAVAPQGFAAGISGSTPTTVLAAVSLKDRVALRSLLKSGADVNEAMGDGLTAIHQVAIDGDTESAQLLIYAGANLKATTRLGGYTPLLIAAKNGDAAMVETLLKGGADPNTATTNGTSPLMFASASGNVVAVRLLLEKGADVGAKEKAMNQTALMFAAANGRTDAVKLLLSRGADVKATTKVVDLWAFTKEAEEAFAAAAGVAIPPLKKAEDGDSAAPAAGVAAAAAKPDAATEAAKAAGLGGATTMSSTVPSKPDATEATMPADKNVAKAANEAAKAKPEQDEKTAKAAEKIAREKSEKEAKMAKAQPAIKDGPPKVALSSPSPAKPLGDSKTPADPIAGPESPEAKPAPPDVKPPTDATKTAAATPAAPKKPLVGGVDRPFLYNEMVAYTGGMTPLLLSIRQGQVDVVKTLIEAGADVNQISGGDKTSALLMATVNGRFDLGMYLLEHGADPNLASENGVAPLYAAVNVQWAPKAGYPQPRAYMQQQTSYLEFMKALIDKGAKVDTRVKKKVWYQGYNFDLSGVDETGATAFWRAAYASDIDAMKLLVARGADPTIRTMKIAGRPRTGDAQREVKDVSGLPPVATGGPAITPLQAAAGVGYGEGFAANSHRFAPTGMLAAVKYLIEDLHADVNANDHEGNTALHHAAARGDNEMIKYLVAHGANVMAVSREGRTTADMANAPVSRIEPFPATIALLEGMGARNNHKCISCDMSPAEKEAAAKAAAAAAKAGGGGGGRK